MVTVTDIDLLLVSGLESGQGNLIFLVYDKDRKSISQ